MKPHHRRLHSAQHGAALIMALLVVALATALASTLIWRQDLWLRQVETRRDLAQARLLAIAGIDWARAVLVDDARKNNYDHKGEPWATKVPTMPAEGGEIGGGLSDEHAKWNLNNLVRNGEPHPESIRIFRELLRQLQLPTTLAETLVDWIDADWVLSREGAEDEHYLKQKPPHRAANRELGSLDNLLAVRGFDNAVIERLRPYVTALPGYNLPNINTASPIVLSAVLPDFPAAEIQQIVAERERIPYIDMTDFRKRLTRHELAMYPCVNNVDTKSSFFTIAIRARYGNAETGATALLVRQGVWPVILWQKFD